MFCGISVEEHCSIVNNKLLPKYYKNYVRNCHKGWPRTTSKQGGPKQPPRLPHLISSLNTIYVQNFKKCMTGFSQFNHCIVCVPDAKPNRGTHFVRRARIERNEKQRSRAPSVIVTAQFCHDGRCDWNKKRLFLLNFNAERVSLHSLQSCFTVLFLQLNKLNACTRWSVVINWRSHFWWWKYFMAGHIHWFSGGADLRYGNSSSTVILTRKWHFTEQRVMRSFFQHVIFWTLDAPNHI